MSDSATKDGGYTVPAHDSRAKRTVRTTLTKIKGRGNARSGEHGITDSNAVVIFNGARVLLIDITRKDGGAKEKVTPPRTNTNTAFFLSGSARQIGMRTSTSDSNRTASVDRS